MKIKNLILGFFILSLTTMANKNLKDFSIVLDWYPNAIHSFLYVGAKKGYYAEEGINLKIQYPANASDGIILPASKRANLGIYYPHNLIRAKVNEDIPLVSIGALTQGPLDIVISLKEMGITRPKDLEGKKLGYASDPLTEAFFKTAMAHDGGDISKLEFVDVGFELLSATLTKRVHATSGGLVNHEVPVLEERGLDINYFSLTDYGVPNYYAMVLVANKEMIENDPKLYEGFLRASKKAFDFTKTSPKESLDILLNNQEEDQFPLKESIEKKSLDMLLPIMETGSSKFLDQIEEVWTDTINWMFENKVIDKKIEAKDIIYKFN